MLSLKEFNHLFEQLYVEFTGERCESISPLAESGSMRKYFRIKGTKGTFIGTYNPNLNENRAFFAFAKSFDEMNLPVPNVLIRSVDDLSYLQSDFGNVSLFTLIQENLSEGTFSPQLKSLFKQIISYLIQFQIVAFPQLDFTKAYPAPKFSSKAIMDDLEYFRYYFLKLHPQIIYDDELLHNDFQQFTDFASQAPSDYFMYRDFQSRNIMIYENKPYFIDFQGGRKGPLQYDLVSLLYQVKAQIPDSIREELLLYYLLELKKHFPFQQVEFMKYYNSFVYLRLFQVLGAYGFRGLIQKKAHFIDSIPYALTTLSDFYEKNNFDGNYPELENIIHQLGGLHAVYKSSIATNEKILTVQINSFSYLKKGIPTDFSGNGGGFVFDCRALPNPGREDRYKMQTGRDKDVIDFLESMVEVHHFFNHIRAISEQTISNYSQRGFKSLVINFGCTGGQHRSVFFAEKTFRWVKAQFPKIAVTIHHNELQ